MPIRSPMRSSPVRREGLALIIVLTLILLLTVLIISFISFVRLNRLATVSYANSVQAQEIAQGGVQDILSDLHSEIIAGSTVQTNGSSAYPPVYVPINNYTAVPARLGYPATAFAATNSTTTLLPTLVRVSRADPGGGAALYPPLNVSNYTNLASVPNSTIANRASKANSSTPSANGRLISSSRWNKPLLLSATTSTSSGGPGLQIPTVFASNTPDWVYVTRAGSVVCTNVNNMKPAVLNGSQLTPPNASPVVGRYAFVVYDEGGLLDANVVGANSSAIGETTVGTYPSYSTTSQPVYTASVNGFSTTVQGKAFPTYADLTQIPGLATSQSQIDSLVNRRNAGGIANANSSGGNLFLGASYTYSQSGFLSFSSKLPQMDSPFLGRQDLINYFSNIDSKFNTASAAYSQALPFLGTFSRAVSAPSWSPPSDASTLGGSNGVGNIYAYHANAEKSSVSGISIANRDLANVRFPQAFASVTHYYDDQTASTPSATYAVNAGDPLLQSRFSLAKIAWLSQPSPVNGSFATASMYAGPIQACFGLTWGTVGVANGGNACWKYTGSSGATAVGIIETLDQVAAEGREPNFFELLKAAILSGSIGLSPGPSAFGNGTNLTNTVYHDAAGGPGGDYLLNNNSPSSISPAGPVNPMAGDDNLYSYSFDRTASTPTRPAPAGISDVQIMQIGANIIDQFDSDSYPTAIYFPYTGITSNNDASGSGNQIFGPSDMVFGDENLPDLQGMIIVTATEDGQPSTYQQYSSSPHPLDDWWQPFIWNCHQMPNPSNSGTPPPNKFIIQGYGQLKMTWTDSGWNAATSPAGSAEVNSTNPVTLDNAQTPQLINFSDNAGNPWNSVFYAAPVLLTSSIPSVSVSTSLGQMRASNFSGLHDSSSNPFVGFWGGTSSSGTSVTPSGKSGAYYGGTTWINFSAQSGGAASFCLGWSATGTDFHPYSFVPGMFSYAIGAFNGNSALPCGGAKLEDSAAESHVNNDPRTNRMGTTCNWEGNSSITTYCPNPFYAMSNDYTEDTYGWGQPAASNFKYFYDRSYDYGFDICNWEVNQLKPLSQTYAKANYYLDQDSVVRPGDGVFGNATTGDGMLLFTSGQFFSNAPSGDSTLPTTSVASGSNSTGNTYHGRRPVILNRPFRNVGELGFVFRDQPFKSLDFFSTASADAALLDVFSIEDNARISQQRLNSVVAGGVNLSNAPQAVIASLLSLGSKKDFDSNYYMSNPATSSTDATALAAAISSNLSPTGGGGPLLNRSGLVTQLGANPTTGNGAIRNSNGASSQGLINARDQSNKAYLEAPIRALADVTNARTWNLMIDVIAQSGQMSPSATTLDDFIVDGEKRYWLHIAIDRYTGKIVDQQLEPVYE